MDKIQTIKFAKQYLEDLLTFFDLNLDVDVKIEDDIVVAAVPHSDRSSILIGRNAETLRSIQYLLSATLNNAGAPVSRVNLDIADYKKQHAEKIIENRAGEFFHLIFISERGSNKDYFYFNRLSNKVHID